MVPNTFNGMEIVFSDTREELSLFYIIFNNKPANKWYDIVKGAISRSSFMAADTSFFTSYDDEIKLVDQINTVINKINEKYNLFIKHIKLGHDLNDLHREVSVISCDLWAKINDAIHSYEQYNISINAQDPRINAYFQFMEDECLPLEHCDMMYFRADRQYGDLCMNYSYKGKHYLELTADDDVGSLTDGQLQPEDRIKAGGYLVFRPNVLDPFYRLTSFVEWYDSNVGKDITLDMAIGYLIVGKLIMPESWYGINVPQRSKWTRYLSKFKILKSVTPIIINTDSIETYYKKSRMDGSYE